MARLTAEDKELVLYRLSQKVKQEALILEAEGLHENNSISAVLKLRESMKDEILEYVMNVFDVTLIELSAVIDVSRMKKNKGSTGEQEVETYLRDHKIEYKREYTIKDLGNYRFDFYLPEVNTCIEFDGEQHFRPIEYFGGEDALIRCQERDEAKNEYCRDNNIELIRIPFYYSSRVAELLNWRLNGV